MCRDWGLGIGDWGLGDASSERDDVRRPSSVVRRPPSAVCRPRYILKNVLPYNLKVAPSYDTIKLICFSGLVNRF
jgi:hypothetical protein